MRTTVTLDPDVEALIAAAMRESGDSFKQVLNDAVREGLRARGRRVTNVRTAYGQPTFRMGQPRTDLTHANAVADDTEDAAIVAKLRRGA